MGTCIDISGKTFGQLLVLERDGTRNGQAYWRCKCSCGKEKKVLGYLLRAGSTKSCGCLLSDANKQQLKKMHEGNIKRESL